MPVYTELQPVFNKIWQEFVVEKRPQAMINMRCIYRSQGNKNSTLRCAIGVCIPDDMYDPKIDTYGAINIVAESMPAWYESVFNGINTKDLRELQRLHDKDFWQFEIRMRVFAEEHDLTIPD